MPHEWGAVTRDPKLIISYFVMPNKSDATFRMTLKAKTNAAERVKVGRATFECFEEFVMGTCEILDENDLVEFVVSGFGQPSWPVDVRTDLSTVIPQLIDALDSMASGGFRFNIDFYEQGLERYLEFDERSRNSVSVSCTSLAEWRPSPKVIVMGKEVLNSEVREVIEVFSKMAEKTSNATTYEKHIKYIKEKILL